jgi:DNA-binding CsgD family transcriptional regulator
LADSLDLVRQGRAAADDRSWAEAHRLLSEADALSPLSADDLVILATASYMLGRDPEQVQALERAHQLYLADGAIIPAVRAAFWTAINLALRGEWEAASGWLGRSHRLLERHDGDTVEAGYLLMPRAIQAAMAGNHEAAITATLQAIEIGQRFDEPDLLALAVYEQGRGRIRQGNLAEGLQLLDEAMVAVLSDGLSPFVTGLIYCGVIEGCRSVHAVRRAHRWTAALTAWCDQQPDLVAFTGQCLTHRAELMQFKGDWDGALDEAEKAGVRFRDGMSQFPAAHAFYRQGEVHRLRGDTDAAEAAYQNAGRWGWPPQPGLALLRLAAGDTRAATASVTTALAQMDDPIERSRVLPGAVEINIAAGDLDAAETTLRELTQIATDYTTATLTAIATIAEGKLRLAQGRLDEAVAAFAKARGLWAALDAPHDTAVARLGLAEAAQQMGDADTTRLEATGALEAFATLGAAPDADRARSLLGEKQPTSTGLSPRELEVLALVAEGNTNREIAAELIVSERTIDRHVSNILTKLGVTTRTAATSFAYEHGIL